MNIHPHHKHTVERVYQLFSTCPDPNKAEHDDGWSIKEILGHLLDSLSNNHQRLLRYTPHQTFEFPAYDQDIFVQRAQYRTYDFQDLLSLWYQYHHLLFHLLDQIPQEHRTSTLTIGARPTITLEQLVTDYFAHMERHEQQIYRILNTSH